MAVLKILVSVALFGTVSQCQQYYAYSPGSASSGLGQYSPSILPRGTPRLVPVKTGQSVAYSTAATTAPVVLKRGRVLPAPSPYSLEAASQQQQASPSTTAALGGVPYAQSYPAISAYRAAPPQPQPQISASPVYHQPQQHQLQIQPQYQQPAYYAQSSPALSGVGRPVKVVKVAKKPLPRPTAAVEAAEEAEEEYPSDPNPQYNFSFDIKDDELTNYQNRQEERDGQTIKGSYSVVDPDGYVRTVTYTADPVKGFQAKVTREPTDVKIKFPVPTEAPAAAAEPAGKLAAGPRRGQYVSPQAQYQPQYQAAAYATPQVYASPVQAQIQPQPQYIPRPVSRFAVQPQSSVVSPRARVARRIRRPSPTPTLA